MSPWVAFPPSTEEKCLRKINHWKEQLPAVCLEGKEGNKEIPQLDSGPALGTPTQGSEGFLPRAATYLLSSVNLPRELSRGLLAMGDLLTRAWSPLPRTGRRLVLTWGYPLCSSVPLKPTLSSPHCWNKSFCSALGSWEGVISGHDGTAALGV